jgi:hypothetical protein
MEEKFPNIAKVDVIREHKIATGFGESTLFGILSSSISGLKSKKTRSRAKKYTFDSFDKKNNNYFNIFSRS